MKNRASISVTRAQNGVIVTVQSDVPTENAQLVATTLEDAKKLATDAIEKVLSESTPKPQ